MKLYLITYKNDLIFVNENQLFDYVFTDHKIIGVIKILKR